MILVPVVDYLRYRYAIATSTPLDGHRFRNQHAKRLTQCFIDVVMLITVGTKKRLHSVNGDSL